MASSSPAQEEEMNRLIPTAQIVPFDKGMTTFVATELDPDQFAILGSEFSEILEIKIPPTFVVSAEPGTMVHLDPEVKAGVDIGSCWGGCVRCCCAGESCCRLNMTNSDPSKPHVVALSGRLPSKIVPIDLRKYPDGVFFRAGGFLAAVGKDWTIELKVTSCGVGCCGGMGFLLNRLKGNNWAFLSAGGMVMRKILEAGETIIVDQNSIFAFESTVKFEVEYIFNAPTMCCGGMGLANARMTGPGFVIMESMSPKKLISGLSKGK